MISNRLQDHSAVFNARFARCRGLLYFIARRVLGRDEGARDAVHNCWLRASHSRPEFAREGAFRSWLVRLLIDEALAILHAKQEPCFGERLACTCVGHRAP
jgi:DNA-directed RNA polymerase specialized sigma24 family protein